MMPFDLDLARKLMLHFEQGEKSAPAGEDRLVVAYHVKQLIDRGLLEGQIAYPSQRGSKFPAAFFVQDITPAGHDFIRAIKKPDRWDRIKKVFADKAAPLTVDLIVAAVKKYGGDLLGL